LEDFRVEESADSAAGKFSGYASVFNQIDLVGDTVLPGAYAETLNKFIRDGFIAWGHDWSDPIATIDSAKEDHKGLWLEATFHSHDTAQRVRKIAQERLARGKSMGLSIGFKAKDWNVRDDGVRELLSIDLAETSLVTFPAEPSAQVASVKASGEEAVGSRRSEGAARPRRPVEEAGEKDEEKEGRVFSGRNSQRIKEHIGSLRAALNELEEMLASSEPSKEDSEEGKEASIPSDGFTAWAEFQRTLALRANKK
jgi:HK97 family phage prohead protease